MLADLHPVDLGAGVRGGFTRRSGGVSKAPFNELNLGFHTGDDAAAVTENRVRTSRWLGAPITWVSQVHGATVAVVGTDGAASVTEADALVTTAPGVGVGIMVADCVPVLLADAAAGVVAAAHAGRPGLTAGVVPAAVAAMVAAGAQPDRISAVLGPSICGRCYEVPAAMRDEVEAAVPGSASVTSWGTPAVDIAAGVLSQLQRLGVRASVVGDCTSQDDRYFSYRRDGVTGRFAGVVALVP